MKNLTKSEIGTIAGGICYCYKDHYGETRDKNGDYMGREGNKKLPTCKERCCSNPENLSWEYSDFVTRGNPKEKPAKGLCGSNEIILTEPSLFSIRLRG